MINLIKDEWIGKKVKIIDSKNKSCIGMKGLIIDETKNKIVIKTNKGERKDIIKDISKIFFVDDNIIIDGKITTKRPEDRIKIKIKK